MSDTKNQDKPEDAVTEVPAVDAGLTHTIPADLHIGDDTGAEKEEQRYVSEHQRYQRQLFDTDNTPKQVDEAWNEYYAGLSEEAKLEVWQEYYARLARPRDQAVGQKPTQDSAEPDAISLDGAKQNDEYKSSYRTMYLTKRIGHMLVAMETINANPFFSKKGQVRSLAIGLACGLLVILSFGFTLFNELIITPFIRPNQTPVPATVPVDETGAPIDPSPKVRIPEINVEIPVIYGLASTDEKQFQQALDDGVVHYPTTVRPGQAGNAAFFGHSSNNIFNPGKYKFAFVLLHQLEARDTFSLTDDGKLYTYEVISRKVVKPTEIGVLGPVEGQTATATLITCDPPGTSNNRLVVVGKQISPDPNIAVAPADVPLPPPPPSSANASDVSSSIPGKAPSLLERWWSAIF